MTVQNENTCDVCKATGLVVFATRYAVVPKDFTAPDLGPFSGARVKELPLRESRYALRQLRKGFVYVFYERGPRGNHYWEVYSVAPDGVLQKQPDARAARYLDAPQACTRSGHSALRQQYFVIDRPAQCGTVWVAFSEYKWSRETLDRYAGTAHKGGRSSDATDAAALRKARMQAIEPAAWIKAPSPGGHVALLTQGNLEHVVEYAPGVAVSGDMTEPVHLPYSRLPDPVSSGDKGAYRSDGLRACTSCYPWSMHNRKEASASLAPSAQLVSYAQSKSSAASSQPMMLALWDAVGVVHQLNGYRNDVNARLVQYADERELQIDALQNIDMVHQAVEANARHAATFAHSAALPGSTGWYDQKALMAARAEALAKAAPAQRGQLSQYYDDLDWMGRNGVPGSYQRRLTQMQTMAGNPLMAANPSIQQAYAKSRENVISDARKYINAKPATAARRDAAIERETPERTVQDWKPYQKYLARDKPDKPLPLRVDVFRELYRRIQADAVALQGARTPDLDTWLGGPLFLDTLGDYDEHNTDDGLAYEIVVGTAVLGLNSEEKGVAVLDRLINHLHPTKAESILWRAVARNQKQPKLALEQALAVAVKHKATVLEKVGEGANWFVDASDKLKDFIAFYEKMEPLTIGIAVTPGDKVLHDSEVDKLVVTAGSRFFKSFYVEAVGNCVGESVIRLVFLTRAGVNGKDAITLVAEQAQFEPQIRAQFLSEFLNQSITGRTPSESFVAASHVVASSNGARVVRERWAALKVGEQAGELRAKVGLAGVIGLIELASFMKLLVQADKNGKEYAQLVAAAFSVAGAVAQIALKPADALMMVRTAKALAELGGLFGAVAAGVGAVVDGVEGVSAGFRRQYGLMFLYLTKSLLGAGATLSGLSTSAPMLVRIASRVTGGRLKLVVLERMGESVAAAAAERAAVVTGIAMADVAVERTGMLILGRALLFLGTWEIQVVIVGIQVLIWWLSPNELQDACAKSAFGVDPEYKTAKQQDEAFQKALMAVGLTKDDASSDKVASNIGAGHE
ncbi:Fis family transcriptional regulator [Paraburkholderia fungorum]|uniref:T6SS effector BTH_I2691 family protein n=1 Tax=Paraburkholderia fungorum TaxID=134537 RepID=UPI0038B6CF38